MKRFGLGRYALSGSVAVTLLAGCGDLQPPHAAPGAMRQSTPITAHYKQHSKIFKYTGSKQTFEVPSGVKWITVIALGAVGGGANGGKGGRVRAMIPVTARERLTVFVGGQGLEHKGGFNGGGHGGAKHKPMRTAAAARQICDKAVRVAQIVSSSLARVVAKALRQAEAMRTG